MANSGSYDTIGNKISVIDTGTNMVTGAVNVGIHPIAFGQFTGAFQAFKPVLIAANFRSNVTNGSAPLSVQFTDLSVNATQWYWDFGDGYASPEQNPSHNYYTQGNYIVNLTVSNDNGTSSKTSIINVLDGNSGGSSSDDSNSGGSNSGGSSSSSSGGGGGSGAGGSPEPQSNVEIKELSQAFIASGQTVKFGFPQGTTPVVSVSFDSKKTFGKTTTISEMLKGKSTLVSGLPSDEIYKYLNIWVGNSGLATPKNIENAIVYFKVEKSWVQDKKIEKSSITLNRYNGNKWDQLPTNLSKEDENYLYLTAKTHSFSPFAITGKTPANVIGTLPAGEKIQPAVSDTKTKLNTGNNTSNLEHTQEKMQSSNISGKQSTRVPGFEITSCIGCLLCVYLYKKRND